MWHPYLLCLPLLVITMDAVCCHQTNCEEGPSALDGHLRATLDTSPVKVKTGDKSRYHANLLCGTLQSRGSPPVSVIWTTPSGITLPSTSYDGGVFHLIPDQVETGQYSCQINSTDPALECLDHDSAMRLKVHVFVDSSAVRLQFLVAHNAELQTANTQLRVALVERMLKGRCDNRIVRGCQGAESSGVHVMVLGTDPIPVNCDQDTAGGGWTVIQRRINGSLKFYRNWTDYENGFWDASGELWMGLRYIHRLTSSDKYSLRVDLEDFDGNTAYAEYRNFRISGPDRLYRLHISGYNGTAGDDMIKHHNLNNMKFSTPDKDHDTWWNLNCAEELHKAGWWFRQCATASLNGRYKAKGARGEDGIVWNYFAPKWTSLKHAEMKIRPRI